jgi:polyisoprenoid-binding protein YceI
LNTRVKYALVGLLIVFCCGQSPAALVAAEPLSPSHFRITDTSQVTFTGSTTLFSFEGTARDIGGTIFYQPGNISESTVGATVPVESLTTFNSWRDEDMYEVFESDSFPRITFQTEAIRASSRTQYDTGTRIEARVKGKFTIHGVSRSETVPVTVTVDPEQLVAEGTFKLDIEDYEMTPPSVMLISQVSPEVKIKLRLVGARVSDR